MNENNGYMLAEMARLHREDRLREAEQYRLEKLALAAEPRTAGLVSRLLYRMGEAMSAWGASLKERYRCAGELTPSLAGDCR